MKTGLIESRRIIFTPDVDLKDELENTAIQITCIDRNGKEVKRVTSSDAGNIEDPENDTSTGSETENGGTNTGGGSENGGGNDDNNNDAPPIINPDLDHPSDGD